MGTGLVPKLPLLDVVNQIPLAIACPNCCRCAGQIRPSAIHELAFPQCKLHDGAIHPPTCCLGLGHKPIKPATSSWGKLARFWGPNHRTLFLPDLINTIWSPRCRHVSSLHQVPQHYLHHPCTISHFNVPNASWSWSIFCLLILWSKQPWCLSFTTPSLSS